MQPTDLRPIFHGQHPGSSPARLEPGSREGANSTVARGQSSATADRACSPLVGSPHSVRKTSECGRIRSTAINCMRPVQSRSRTLTNCPAMGVQQIPKPCVGGSNPAGGTRTTAGQRPDQASADAARSASDGARSTRAASIRSATAFRASPSRWPYRTGVMAAEGCPSMGCAPSREAGNAAVWRSSCGTRPSAGAAAAARSKWPRRDVCVRKGVPDGDGEDEVVRLQAASWMARSSRRNRGTGTRRRACDFGGPRTVRPSTSVADSATSMRLRSGSIRRTRSAVPSPTAGRCSPA